MKSEPGLLDARDLAAIRKQTEEQFAHERYIARRLEAKEKDSQVRTFETGATRDADIGKHDYEGFYSPMVVYLFGQYMNKHRIQTDGSLRDSDNWQKGIPISQCLKSTWRHLHDLWCLLRGLKIYKERLVKGERTIVRFTEPKELPDTWITVTIPDSACGILFNVQALLLQWAKENL